MKGYLILLGTALIIGGISIISGHVSVAGADSQSGSESPFHALRGPYLGQEPPGMEARIFAPGLISGGHLEANISFTPDGMEFAYSVFTRGGRYLAEPTGPFRTGMIMCSRVENGYWTDPKEFSFNLERNARYPFYSPDGSRLYFNSRRNVTDPPDTTVTNTWYVKRANGDWGEPQEVRFAEGYDGRQSAVFPTVATNGNLYYTLFPDRVNGILFMSQYEDGSYSSPRELSDVVNHHRAVHPYIAPDESYIIFDDDPPEDNHGGTDLYVSFRDKNGSWMKPQNLGDRVNTPYLERRPFVTFDGKYLFFASNRIENTELLDRPYTLQEIRQLTDVPEDGYQHIYWIDAAVIEDLRPEKGDG